MRWTALLCVVPSVVGNMEDNPSFCSRARGMMMFDDVKSSNINVTGMTFNKAKTHLFTIAKNMKISVVDPRSGDASSISIALSGVSQSDDWDAIVSRPCFDNANSNCLVIAAIGGCFGKLRFVQFEEPNAGELRRSGVLRKEAKEYAFSFPGGSSFDAEALVVTEDRKRTFLITNNGNTAYGYVHVFEVMFDKQVTLEERSIFKVGARRVTDATSTASYLVLRTSDGIHFYDWQRICESEVRTSKIWQEIDLLKTGHGEQKALEFKGGEFYFVGAGNENLFHARCVAAEKKSPITRGVEFTGECKKISGNINPNNVCPVSEDSSGRFVEWILIGGAAGLVIGAIVVIAYAHKSKVVDNLAPKPSFLVQEPQPRDHETPLTRARELAHRDRERHHRKHHRTRSRKPDGPCSELVAPNFR